MSDDLSSKKLALLNEYRSAFWSEPTDIEVLITLAKSYRVVGLWQEGVKLLKRAVALAPKCALAHFLLGEIYEQVERVEDAAFSYAQATELDSTQDLDADYRVHELIENMADKSEALQLLQRVCDRYSGNRYFQQSLAKLLYSLQQYSESEKIYRGLLAREGVSSEERLELQLALAQVLIDGSNYLDGFPLMEQVLPQLGSDYDVLSYESWLGDAYIKAGRFQLALNIFIPAGRSLGRSEAKAIMLRKIARCYQALRQYDRAIEYLIEILTFVSEVPVGDNDSLAVIQNPKFFEDVYAALTWNYEAKGDFHKARETFKKEKEYYAKVIAVSENKCSDESNP